MIRRNAQQRRQAIMSLLSEHGEVSVEQLTSFFDISEVTIRKDLATLEKNGLLLRRYGGAVIISNDTINTHLPEKISKQKKAIVKEAAALIRDHNRIIIDSGSTTAALIPELRCKHGLVAMTNSLHVANALLELENEPSLLMTGGTWDPHSESFQGQAAEQVLRSYDFDQLFIGADGIDVTRGSTSFNELLGLSRLMAEVSRQVVVMVDSDKVGRKMPNLELPWSSIDVLICDDELSEQHRIEIEKCGVQVICASTQSE